MNVTSIHVSVGDTVIIRLDDTKYHAVYITKMKSNGTIQGQPVNEVPSPTLEENPVQFLAESVIANLGQYPAPGVAYGIILEPYTTTIETALARAEVFQNFDNPRWGKCVKNAIKTVVEGLEKTGIVKKVHEQEHEALVIHIRPRKGKMLGFFKKSRSGADIICLRIDDDSLQTDMLPYIVWHEVGHLIYSRFFNEDRKSTWIKLYHDSLSLMDFTLKDCLKLLERFESAEFELASLSEIQKKLQESGEDSNFILFKNILRHIKKTHSLTPGDIDTLRATGHSIRDFWPTTGIQVSEMQLVVSDYATKSVQEFWCESLSFYMTGKELPKNIRKSVKSTLAWLPESFYID